MSALDALLRAAPRSASVGDVDLAGDPDDPRVSLAWLLRMAERTRDAAPAEVDPAQLAALEAQLADRPARDEELGQLHVDAASCLRRAAHVRGHERVVAVGDDDGVTLALRLLGHREVCALDLDERLLAFLAAEGVETHRADFLEGSVPAALRRRFTAAVTDPFRDLDGGLGFLCFAAACLAPGGALYWVDDPLWNPEHGAVREAMARLGWHVVEAHLDVHAYPLSLASFDPSAIVEALGVERAWIEALVTHTCAWSNLYRLAR
ncbi:MAG: bis-aminopropyl spermidine synthase family protein [Sandaracinaceae bacterium]|nr:bis-aminopropyl spermidine synthase family protein [Sandaracinaceae bacterium]